jgi:predicted MFS family arabinose efflux permease
MINQPQSNYKWYILAMGTATHIFVVAMARLSLSVLFQEISDDLGLSLVQIGTIWGMSGLAGLFTAFAYGLLGDRYGTRLTLGVTCLLSGITGALRGLSGGFTGLATYSFFVGLFGVPLSFTTHKAVGQWFPGNQLGLANGVLAMGMGVGVTLGSMINATVLSPWLGGWRNIMFVYGAISVLIGFLWFQTRRAPDQGESAPATGTVPFRQALLHVIQIRNLWLLALSYMCLAGSSMALIGYLPLYLRSIGWTGVSADGALAALGAASVVGVIPLSYLSDRIGLRKAILYPSILTLILGIGLLSISGGALVWLLVIWIGTVREGFFAVLITMSMESKGVGTEYAGTALGLMWSFAYLGNFFSPPLGNRLAEINPRFAFIFWSALAVIALFVFHFVEETGWRKKQIYKVAASDYDKPATV